jgi:LAS superfamily LD-carboxypeptidase LdcB
MGYEERRVYVKVFGAIPSTSPHLVAVAGVQGKDVRLHTLAADGFRRLAAAAEQALGIRVQAASGWREHKWKSREEYEKSMIAKYGSLAEGQKKMAFDSPHETGLAVDFGSGGLEPKSATMAAQRKTPLHAWLVEHAHEYGFHPYKNEPWHWEFPVSKVAHETGVIAAGDPGYEEQVSFGVEDEDEFVEELEDFESPIPQ